MNDQTQTSQHEKMHKAAAFALTILAIFLAFRIITEFKTWGTIGSNDQHVITVQGKGETFAVPDIATFTFSVIEEGKTVAEAQKKSAEKNNAAIKYLKDAGIADKDIKTESYNANPRYDYPQIVCIKYPCPPSKPTLTGYEVSQTISVKVRDTAKAGDMLSGIGAIGVANISGLSFVVDNDDTIKAEARAEAIADAKTKAQKLAKELGVKLGKVVSFSEDAGGYPYPMYAMESKAVGMGGGGAAPQVPTGENKVTVNVNVTYQIK